MPSKLIKKHPKLASAIGLSALALLGLAGFYWGWFSGEPKYHGRSVTYWVNQIAFSKNYDTRRGPGAFFPGTLATDPALHSVLALRSNAVPTLVGELSSVSEISDNPSLVESFYWLEQKEIPANRQFIGRAFDLHHPSKAAVGLVLIVLGNENSGGIGTVLKAFARAPNDITGTKYPALFIAVKAAYDGFPERRKEITEGLQLALRNPDPNIRHMAILGTYAVPAGFELWKKDLIHLAIDPDERVSTYAIGTLARLRKGDPDVLEVLEQVVRNPRISDEQRTSVLRIIGSFGSDALPALPLLRQMRASPNFGLRSSSSWAISEIENQAKLRGIPIR